MLSQSNANLLSVSESGTSEEWGAPAGAGPEKWSGDERVYVREKRRQVAGSTGLDFEVDRTVVVEASRPSVRFEREDVVRILYRGEELTATIAEVDGADPPPGIPAPLATIRLTLEAAAT